MWFTLQADEAWDQLFDPANPQGPVQRAIELLDEIRNNPDRAWTEAEKVSVPDHPKLDVRRTLIEKGSPSLWIYWYIHSEKGVIILDFLATV